MFDYKSLKYITVLYIEDDEYVAEMTSDYLKEYCDSVYVAHNGKEGLDLYYQKKPDIIITDISMPVMDGLEMSGIIREKDHDTPIIINSAFSDIKLFIDAINKGVNDYILKPVYTDKLVESLYKNSKYTLMTRALKTHKKMMQNILDEIGDPVLVFDLDHKVSIANKSAKKMLDKHKYFGNKILHLDNVYSEDELLDNCIKDKKLYKGETVYEDRLKNIYYFEVLYKPILDKNDKVYAVLKILHDVTKHKVLQNKLLHLNNKLTHQAHHDSLTDLPNRTNLRKVINEEIKKRSKFALFFIDLDNFKDINDTYGHDVGDTLLIDVSSRIQRVLKRTDFIARLGGDEFCIVIKNISDIDNISAIAKKINKIISSTFTLNDIKMYLTCSIGIALYPQDANTPQELLKNADTAMYSIKHNGKNGFCFYEKYMNQKNKQRLTLESQLREALKNKEFEVYFQPQISTIENKIIGYEALIRWNHPTLGLLSPAEFLDTAKHIGIMDKIDEFVMSEAIQNIKYFNCIKNNMTISINISAHILYKNDFIDNFTSLLEKFGCEAKYIEIELTEDELISDIAKTTPVLKTLEEMGTKISIDDFGTGYSSMRYLKDLKVDRLKIDKSFIDDIDNENSTLIIKAIIALGKSLNLSIIAEGVESERQKIFLEENGCSEIQGYFYSKPLSKEEIKFFNKTMGNTNV